MARIDTKTSIEIDEWIDSQLRGKNIQCSHAFCAGLTKTVNEKFKTNITVSSIRNRLQRLRLNDAPQEEPQPMNDNESFMLDVGGEWEKKRKKQDGLKGTDMLECFLRAQKEEEEVDISGYTAKRTIKTNAPIAIVSFSDVHIGSKHSRYDLFLEHWKLVQGDKRFYVLKGGDWADNFQVSFKDASAVMGQIKNPMYQKLTVEKLLKEMEKRIVAAIGGNHDDMDERRTGMSTEYFIYRNMEFPYLKEGGLVELTVGGQTYNILWKHNYRGNSALNPTNSHRWLRMLEPKADICILEHVHNSMIQVREVDGLLESSSRTVIDIRSGAYKTTDPYSVRGFKPGTVSPETVVLFPAEKKMVAFHGIDAIFDAQTFLDGWEAQNVRKVKVLPKAR